MGIIDSISVVIFLFLLSFFQLEESCVYIWGRRMVVVKSMRKFIETFSILLSLQWKISNE